MTLVLWFSLVLLLVASLQRNCSHTTNAEACPQQQTLATDRPHPPSLPSLQPCLARQAQLTSPRYVLVRSSRHLRLLQLTSYVCSGGYYRARDVSSTVIVYAQFYTTAAKRSSNISTSTLSIFLTVSSGNQFVRTVISTVYSVHSVYAVF